MRERRKKRQGWDGRKGRQTEKEECGAALGGMGRDGSGVAVERKKTGVANGSNRSNQLMSSHS